jgi:hypothetical protein
MNKGRDQRTGKFLPGNKYASVKHQKALDQQKAIASLKDEFPPEEWGARLAEIWETASKMNSAKVQLAVLNFVADRVVGKPVVTHEIDKNETKRILTLLVDNPAEFRVEKPREIELDEAEFSEVG